MLHTIKERGDGGGTPAPWAPTVRRPMLRGFSAAAWQRFSLLSLLVLFLTMFLMVGFAIAGANDTGVRNFAIVFIGLVVSASLSVVSRFDNLGC